MTTPWAEQNHALNKTFIFPSFPEAIAFVTRVAFAAEKIDHHPDMDVRYNQVNILLQTHHAGNAVSEKDHALAKLIDGIANSMTLASTNEGCGYV